MREKENNYILGLDAATKKTGFAVIDSNMNLIDFGVIRTVSDDTKDRMKELYNAIEGIILEYEIQYIALEDVPITNHNNLKTGKDLSILQGIILSLCFKYDIIYNIYNPSSWRSTVGTYDGTREGTKRAVQKQKAVQMVNDIYKLNFVYNETETKTRVTDDDKAEAILIARAFMENNRKQGEC